jgi:uncharacterized heparinase superfamily protein
VTSIVPRNIEPAGASSLAVEALKDGTRTLFRLSGLLATRTMARFSPRRLMRFNRPFAVPSDVVAVPRLIAQGDAAQGAELYGGVFAFAGERVETAGASVFAMRAPSRQWAERLHGFGWLADLAAADNALSRAYARALVEDWNAQARHSRAARRPQVTARRLINLLAFAPFLLEGAEAGFQRDFLRALGRHSSTLRRDIRRLPPGLPRLLPAIALTSAGLSLSDGSRAMRAGSENLNTELRRLVLPDGGPATRNPDDLLSWAVDLLPLRRSFLDRAIEPPRELLPAIDRIMPMLRFFRHPDNTLALFNGMGPTHAACLDAVLEQDDANGLPVLNAAFSGYQRLEGADAVMIIDTGTPPPLELSGRAHAGTLSFEMSAGSDKLIVNCGSAAEGAEAMQRAARRTAAHSTVTLDDASSSRFLKGWTAGVLGALLRDGPRAITLRREDKRDGSVLRGSHDGYAARFGFLHERTLRLHANGRQVDGLDVIRPVRQGSVDAVLRFHLHPMVRATRLNGGSAVLLVPPSGDVWLFSCDDRTADIEESVYFALDGGARPAEQIVVRLGRKAGARVSWSLTRTGSEMAPSALGLA